MIGLAVITASLDLCSSTLKRTFTKLHYFGRKIRGARRGFANVSDDIREAMRIIAALKKNKVIQHQFINNTTKKISFFTLSYFS